MRPLRALCMMLTILVTVGSPSIVVAKSTKSPDGIFSYNEYVTVTLRASSAETTTGSVVNGTAVAGFGGWRELELFVDITDVSFTGGTAPTAQLDVWLQRTSDGGTTWDDVLATQSAALSAGQTEKDLGYALIPSAGTPASPAAVQTAGGTPPFAQRFGPLSDSLRVAWRITTTGTPTTTSVTFLVQARGR